MHLQQGQRVAESFTFAAKYARTGFMAQSLRIPATHHSSSRNWATARNACTFIRIANNFKQSCQAAYPTTRLSYPLAGTAFTRGPRNNVLATRWPPRQVFRVRFPAGRSQKRNGARRAQGRHLPGSPAIVNGQVSGVA